MKRAKGIEEVTREHRQSYTAVQGSASPKGDGRGGALRLGWVGGVTELKKGRPVVGGGGRHDRAGEPVDLWGGSTDEAFVFEIGNGYVPMD